MIIRGFVRPGAAARLTSRAIDHAFDGDNPAGGVENRREPVFDVQPKPMRGTDEVVDGRAAAMPHRSTNESVDALAIGGSDQVGERHTFVSNETMRIVAREIPTSGADELHRPGRVMPAPIHETAEVLDQPGQRRRTFPARRKAAGAAAERGVHHAGEARGRAGGGEHVRGSQGYRDEAKTALGRE